MRAVLDLGAHFTSVSEPLVEMLEQTFPGVPMRIPFTLGTRQAITASGQIVSVTQRTIPLQLTVVTRWGPELLPPISFAIMPGSDGVVILGLPTLRDLGVDPYSKLWTVLRARRLALRQGVETPAFLGSRQVSLSVAAFQKNRGQVSQEPDLAVECLVERGLEMFMDPAEEEYARRVGLEKSVTNAVAQGLSV